MKKLKKFLVLIIMSAMIFTTACSGVDKEVEKISMKDFRGFKGGQILVFRKKGSNNFIMAFSGKNVIKPNTKPGDIKPGEEEKSRLKEYYNVKIFNENGDKYLTADDFPYKIKIVDENKILDVEDGNEYTYVDLYKSTK